MAENLNFMLFNAIHTKVDPNFLMKAFRSLPGPTVAIKDYIFTVIEGEFYGQREHGPKHVLCMLTTPTEGVSGVGIATCSDLDEFIPARGQHIAFIRAVRDATQKQAWKDLGITLQEHAEASLDKKD